MKNVKHWIIAIILLSGLSALAQTPDQVDANAAEAMMIKAQNLKQDMERLKALQPLPKEQLLLLLPESLGELKRTKHFAGDESGMGVISVRGTYNTIGEPEFVVTDTGAEISNKKNKTFSIEIMDGAGPGAPMFSSMLMMSDINLVSADENEEVKPVTMNGIGGRQKYNKKSIHTGLHFIYLDRFSISATGGHLTPEETKEHFEKFDLQLLTPKN